MSADPNALFAQAGTCLQQGRLQEAESLYRQVLQRQPRHAEALHMLGVVALQSGHARQALEFINAAIAIGATAGMHFNAGIACHAIGELDQALAQMLRAAELAPDWAEALNNAGVGWMECGRADEAMELFRRATELDPANREAASNYLMSMLYLPSLPARWVAEQHLAVGKRYGPGPISPPPARVSRAQPRIGFVSGDFRMHPVGLMMRGLLRSLAPSAVEVRLYSNNDRTDEITAGFVQSGINYQSIAALSDEAAAELIRQDQLDILIDLSGHTALNRLGVFALRPAPVQVSWLGYGATTGLSMMDYILVDPHCVSAADQAFFSEKLAYLPHSRLLYSPPERAPEVAPPPSLRAGHVTFGCFNNVVKLNVAVASTWAGILRRVPSAKLLLKGRQYHQASCQRYVAHLLSANGVDLSRVLIEGYHSYDDYLSAYSRVDIALDPFPFPGGATSLDGLWMGVPVLTCQGESMIARQGVSILNNLALSDWVARDQADYVSKAIEFASDAEVLTALRQSLRGQMASSPICAELEFSIALTDLLVRLEPRH